MDGSIYLDELARILDPRRRDLAPEKGALGFARATVRGVDEQARTVEAVVSDESIDRYGEIIAREFWTDAMLRSFLDGNPVLLAGHQHASGNGEPTVIGHWVSLKWVNGSGLVGVAKFAESELAEKWWQLYLQRSMRAFSVGFIAHQWEMRSVEVGEGETQRIRVFTAGELVEVSAVAVPANASALVRAAGLANMPTDPAAMRGGSEDDDGTGGGPCGDGTSGAGLSNRKAAAVMHRTMKPVIRDLMRELVPAACKEGFHALATGGYVEVVASELLDAYRIELANMLRSGGASVDPRYVQDPYGFTFDDAAGGGSSPPKSLDALDDEEDGEDGEDGEDEDFVEELRRLLDLEDKPVGLGRGAC